jgi:hypothetical protein
VIYPQRGGVVGSMVRSTIASVAAVASFTRAKTHSPGMMKGSEDGTSHVNDPVFLILSEDIVNQLLLKLKRSLYLLR